MYNMYPCTLADDALTFISLYSQSYTMMDFYNRGKYIEEKYGQTVLFVENPWKLWLDNSNSNIMISVEKYKSLFYVY